MRRQRKSHVRTVLRRIIRTCLPIEGKISISTTGETRKGKISLDRETHDFHVGHIDVRDQWDMQVDSRLSRTEIL